MDKSENFYKWVYENLIDKDYTSDDLDYIMISLFSYKANIMDFEKPDPDNMLEVYEDERAETDAKLISKYDSYISGSEPVVISQNIATVPYENAIKLKYKDRTMYAAYDLSDYTDAPDYQLPFELTIFTNIEDKRRMLLASKDYALRHNLETPIFEDIQNFDEILDKCDEENESNFRKYLSDLTIDFGNLGYQKHFYVKQSLEEKILDIEKTYEVPFILSMKDGYLSITSKLSDTLTYNITNEYIYKLADLVEQIFSLIDLIDEYR